MWHRGTVFVVQSDEIAGNHFAKDLRELRWRVHCFASVNALLERLSGQVTDAIVLRDRYDDPSLSIAAARRPRRARRWPGRTPTPARRPASRPWTRARTLARRRT